MRWFEGLLASLLIMPFTVSASPYTELELPTPLGYVSDYAQILSPQWKAQIRAVCKDLELRTGVEMIVVAMPSANPLSAAGEYASKLYKRWRIGTAQQERGILLFVSMEEQQAVVVLGRSLLSVISRDQLNQISQRFFVPMFGSSRYGENLYQAAVRLASLSGNAPLPSGNNKKSRSKGILAQSRSCFYDALYPLALYSTRAPPSLSTLATRGILGNRTRRLWWKLRRIWGRDEWARTGVSVHSTDLNN